nr:hypothetical protein CFP56_62789 [Quercus suber]
MRETSDPISHVLAIPLAVLSLLVLAWISHVLCSCFEEVVHFVFPLPVECNAGPQVGIQAPGPPEGETKACSSMDLIGSHREVLPPFSWEIKPSALGQFPRHSYLLSPPHFPKQTRGEDYEIERTMRLKKEWVSQEKAREEAASERLRVLRKAKEDRAAVVQKPFIRLAEPFVAPPPVLSMNVLPVSAPAPRRFPAPAVVPRPPPPPPAVPPPARQATIRRGNEMRADEQRLPTFSSIAQEAAIRRGNCAIQPSPRFYIPLAATAPPPPAPSTTISCGYDSDVEMVDAPPLELPATISCGSDCDIEMVDAPALEEPATISRGSYSIAMDIDSPMPAQTSGAEICAGQKLLPAFSTLVLEATIRRGEEKPAETAPGMPEEVKPIPKPAPKPAASSTGPPAVIKLPVPTPAAALPEEVKTTPKPAPVPATSSTGPPAVLKLPVPTPAAALPEEAKPTQTPAPMPAASSRGPQEGTQLPVTTPAAAARDPPRTGPTPVVVSPVLNRRSPVPNYTPHQPGLGPWQARQARLRGETSPATPAGPFPEQIRLVEKPNPECRTHIKRWMTELHTDRAYVEGQLQDKTPELTHRARQNEMNWREMCNSTDPSQANGLGRTARFIIRTEYRMKTIAEWANRRASKGWAEVGLDELKLVEYGLAGPDWNALVSLFEDGKASGGSSQHGANPAGACDRLQATRKLIADINEVSRKKRTAARR